MRCFSRWCDGDRALADRSIVQWILRIQRHFSTLTKEERDAARSSAARCFQQQHFENNIEGSLPISYRFIIKDVLIQQWLDVDDFRDSERKSQWVEHSPFIRVHCNSNHRSVSSSFHAIKCGHFCSVQMGMQKRIVEFFILDPMLWFSRRFHLQSNKRQFEWVPSRTIQGSNS